eukprot:m.188668 g.188668  ORF g.188668 m.188668 type:complete len:243 (-) comp10028_c0_seq2:127-855(-)
MKLLDNPQFTRLAEAISAVHNHTRLSCQLESYSCKMAGADKRLYKQISHEGPVSDLEILSSPASFEASSLSRSPGTLCNACSKKTLYYLKATLNAAYNPDYDFSNARSDEFRRETDYVAVIRGANSNLFAALGESYDHVAAALWRTVAAEIDPENVADCEIYSYNPDTESDPFAEEGTLWSFNYFFFNKRLRRIVFFACRATSLSCEPDTEGEESADEAEGIFTYDDDSGIRDDSLMAAASP